MRKLLAVGISLSVIVASLFAFSHRESVPLASSKTPVDNMNITDLAKSSQGILAAGELGHILLSNNHGQQWKVANIDKKRHALITKMAFKDENVGLAIGHEGWILMTLDGGLNWQEVQFDITNSDPLLDVKWLDSGHWLVIGAFGKMLTSQDGLTWKTVPAPEGTDWHLNAIIPSVDNDGRMLLIGEAGTVFTSKDLGQQWQKIAEFYTGSFYGGLHLGGREWLIYGMRGNIFKTLDDGLSWHKIPQHIPVSIFSHIQLSDGQILLGAQGGFTLQSVDKGKSFKLLPRTIKPATITDITVMKNGVLLLGSDKGLSVQAVPESQEQTLLAMESTHE